MGRGFVWAAYIDDVGSAWALQVDEDYALDPDRGWFTEGVDSLAPLPRGWRPRRVVGIDESGRKQYAVAAHVGCAIWSGTVATFVFETTAGFPAVADIIGREGERRRSPRVETP